MNDPYHVATRIHHKAYGVIFAELTDDEEEPVKFVCWTPTIAFSKHHEGPCVDKRTAFAIKDIPKERLVTYSNVPYSFIDQFMIGFNKYVREQKQEGQWTPPANVEKGKLEVNAGES